MKSKLLYNLYVKHISSWKIISTYLQPWIKLLLLVKLFSHENYP